MRYVFPAIEISIVRHWQMKKLFYNTKSGLMVFGFCPAGSTCKVDLTLYLDVLTSEKSGLGLVTQLVL